MATKVEPWAVLERVLQIYRERAAVLLPMSLAVATFAAFAPQRQPGLEIVAFVLYLLAGALFAGAAAQIAHATAHPGVDGSARTLMRAGVRALLPTVALGLAEGIAVGAGFVLMLRAVLSGRDSALATAGAAVVLLFVWIALTVRWAVVVPVAVIERRRLGASFRRSSRLVRGQSWRTLGSVALVYLPVAALGALARAAVAGASTTTHAFVVAAVATVTLPVATLTWPVLYHALLATSPAAGEPPAPAPRPPRWLLRGTRWRVALWSFLALAWFLFLPDFVLADVRPHRASTVGAVVWTVGMALLVRCAWVTARSLRAARRAAKADAT